MNQELDKFELSLAQAEKDLIQFKVLLDSSDELSEKHHILPFFQQHPHLAVLAGSANLKIETIDLARREFSLFSHFRCDWAIGDSSRAEYSLIEFEDARAGSVFSVGAKYHDEWGKRLERGFSQVVDWFWSIDAYRETPDYKRNFGDNARFSALLIIGRDKFLAAHPDLERRLKWRHRHTLIHGAQVECITFDQLYQFLRNRLTFVRGIAERADLA